MATIRSRIVANLTELLQAATAEGFVVSEREARETFSANGRVAFVFHAGERVELEGGGPEAQVLCTLQLRIVVIIDLSEVAAGQSPGEALDDAVAQIERLLPLDDPQTLLALPIVDLRFSNWTADRASIDGQISTALELECVYRHDSGDPSAIGGAIP